LKGEERSFVQLVAKGGKRRAWSPPHTHPHTQGIMGNCVACPKPTVPPIQACLEGREVLLFDPISNMSANNAGSKRNGVFVYHGWEGDVIHVRVHPSIRVIHVRAFLGKMLMSVELHNGIEVI
jgi:hypothetical protein